MLNTLRHCRENSVPALLETAPGLSDKVDASGQLLPFPGNTVVFLLDEQVKRQLSMLQEELYSRCGDFLAQRLHPDTFHMTLHDLANGSCLSQKEEMAHGAKEILDRIRGAKIPPIPMKAACSFNMVNTSIVLLLEPADDDAWQQLDDLYMQFQQVRTLPYALTPHITLAYFRPGCYPESQTHRLRCALTSVELDVMLEPRALVLQDFDHMNAYKTIY